MSNSPEPSCLPPGIPKSISKLHSLAFRDLEGRISDCESMAQIAAQLMCKHASGYGKLVFAVCNTGRMLKALMADYYAAWHNEKPIEP
ncbi:hypothetical protein ABIB85_007445 [Bradyrhizobium sp. JR1.5]|uniref:hypothetical protein n=1 Tax=Bradyrhizobium sp. WSM1253 TaxID=319003 RepID=UPI00025D2D65|nr:hypothetical protein [Bradyrhizobium sp. WSM1253]EIG62201.1 hypothetical protein Bra1253DRAFT_07092 [Bradyrhizobium sp. WSM1253]